MKTRPAQLSSADLIVLSLLAESPMHGYKLVSELELRGAQDCTSISRPQVYYSINKLAKMQLIESASNDMESLGPVREVFRINKKGMRGMNDELDDLKWAQQRASSPFMTWMALSSHLTSGKITLIVAARQAYLATELQKEKNVLKEFDLNSGSIVSPGRLMVSLSIELFKVELRWLEKVRSELLINRWNNGHKKSNNFKMLS